MLASRSTRANSILKACLAFSVLFVHSARAGTITSPFNANDRVVSVSVQNDGGGSLVLDQAFAGGSSDGTEPAGNVIVQDFSARSTTSEGVDVSLFATPGRGAGSFGPGQIIVDPTDPNRGPVYGSSDGGPVRVSARFSGLLFLPVSGVRDGFSVAMDSVADGDSSGLLRLSQTAAAGFGGSGPTDAGSGGDARNVLAKDTHSSFFTLEANAFGGLAGIDRTPRAGDAPVRGGDADVVIRGTNTGGRAAAFGEARGGHSGEQQQAGDASLDIMMTTLGDGQRVSIGFKKGGFISGECCPPTDGAYGGDVSNQQRLPNSIPLGSGGDASSHSVGVAHGDSEVRVLDYAFGGRGGSGRPPQPGGVFGTQRAGDGGDAESVAYAIGGGLSDVIAEANATGGEGGRDAQIEGAGGDALVRAEAMGSGTAAARARALGGESHRLAPGGDAFAFSEASGTGFVEATADAFGGTSSRAFDEMMPGVGGSAKAIAIATGDDGFARARAGTGRGSLPGLRAISQAFLPGRRAVSSEATHGAALPERFAEEGPAATSFLTGAPLQSDAALAVAGNAALEDRFLRDASAGLVALGQWTAAARSKQAGPARFEYELSLTLTDNELNADELILAAFDLGHIGEELVSFVFELWTATGMRTEIFSTADEVRDFFEDELILVSLDGLHRGSSILAGFEVVLEKGSSFGMGLAFAQVVPEPGTGLLLALGLIVLGLRRPRKR